MQCVSFFAALALVLGAGKTMACENAGCAIGDELAPTECNSIGCVRPTNGFDNLAKIAERSLSVMRVPDSANALRLCNAGTCATEPALTRLPERCGRAGCIMPEPKAPRPAVSNADVSASTPASTLVTDVFATLTERPTRLSPAVPWADWPARWGLGGYIKAVATH